MELLPRHLNSQTAFLNLNPCLRIPCSSVAPLNICPSPHSYGNLLYGVRVHLVNFSAVMQSSYAPSLILHFFQASHSVLYFYFMINISISRIILSHHAIPAQRHIISALCQILNTCQLLLPRECVITLSFLPDSCLCLLLRLLTRRRGNDQILNSQLSSITSLPHPLRPLFPTYPY